VTLNDFPITVNNKPACVKLMQAIESSLPKLLWGGGQKPTGFIPDGHNFPIQICLVTEYGYYHMYYKSRRGL